MQGGRLDRYLTVQRPSEALGEDGSPVVAWGTLGDEARRPASIRPVRGDERFTAPQLVAREQVEFRIRYASALADLSPLDRIIYPALTDAEVASPPASIATRRLYDILSVAELGRREGFQIIAARRADVTT